MALGNIRCLMFKEELNSEKSGTKNSLATVPLNNLLEYTDVVFCMAAIRQYY